MRTRITDLLGIEHPIIQGGMHRVGLAALAVAAIIRDRLAGLPGAPADAPIAA